MFIPPKANSEMIRQIQIRSPTALDRLITSKNLFFAFAGIIVGVSAWVIMRDEPLFSSTNDPYGDPSEWTVLELRGWLQARNLEFSETETRADLVERVKANIATPRTPLLPRT
ncbi:hypothetical protein K440DRAFT_408293 [Wilcoxina mikolae CBS 423.85]|nr:hypothetical protein K440DRAFT_408293 [Wilcoxina mikolae CBS 423.85]